MYTNIYTCSKHHTIESSKVDCATRNGIMVCFAGIFGGPVPKLYNCPYKCAFSAPFCTAFCADFLDKWVNTSTETWNCLRGFALTPLLLATSQNLTIRYHCTQGGDLTACNNQIPQHTRRWSDSLTACLWSHVNHPSNIACATWLSPHRAAWSAMT